MTLAHAVVRGEHAQGAAPAQLLFLHGLLGRGENWRGFARRLLRSRPEYDALLVDLRMHGDSQALSSPHTLARAADDVRALTVALENSRAGGAARASPAHAIIGHSFGGKVALRTLSDPPASLRECWVLDASPSARRQRSEDDTTARVLAALRTLPGSVPNRGAFVDDLGRLGIDRPLGLWLAKNLVPGPTGGLRFGLDLDAIAELLADYDRSDLWSLCEAPPPGVALRFVLAGRSNAVPPDARERLAALHERGVLELHVLEHAGHWLHIDDPEGLLRVLSARLGH